MSSCFKAGLVAAPNCDPSCLHDILHHAQLQHTALRQHTCVQSRKKFQQQAWAAQCNTWLRIKLTLKGVVFPFLVFQHQATPIRNAHMCRCKQMCAQSSARTLRRVTVSGSHEWKGSGMTRAPLMCRLIGSCGTWSTRTRELSQVCTTASPITLSIRARELS